MRGRLPSLRPFTPRTLRLGEAGPSQPGPPAISAALPPPLAIDQRSGLAHGQYCGCRHCRPAGCQLDVRMVPHVSRGQEDPPCWGSLGPCRWGLCRVGGSPRVSVALQRVCPTGQEGRSCQGGQGAQKGPSLDWGVGRYRWGPPLSARPAALWGPGVHTFLLPQGETNTTGPLGSPFHSWQLCVLTPHPKPAAWELPLAALTCISLSFIQEAHSLLKESILSVTDCPDLSMAKSCCGLGTPDPRCWFRRPALLCESPARRLPVSHCVGTRNPGAPHQYPQDFPVWVAPPPGRSPTPSGNPCRCLVDRQGLQTEAPLTARATGKLGVGGAHTGYRTGARSTVGTPTRGQGQTSLGHTALCFLGAGGTGRGVL